MIETRITNEKPPVVYDLDDFRHGLGNRPNDAGVTVTSHHKVSLWTIQAGKTVPLHTHSDSECVIIVMAGQGEYMWGNRSMDMKKDMLTIASPGAAHGFRNNNTEPLVVLTIEGPGPFDVRPPGA